MRFLVAAALALLAPAAAGMHLAGPTTTIVADSFTLVDEEGASVVLRGYRPPTAAVDPGGTIRFVNADGFDGIGNVHTLTSGFDAADGHFDSGDVPAGGEVSFAAPATPGLYPFHCAFDPEMRGVLRVG